MHCEQTAYQSTGLDILEVEVGEGRRTPSGGGHWVVTAYQHRKFSVVVLPFELVYNKKILLSPNVLTFKEPRNRFRQPIAWWAGTTNWVNLPARQAT